MSNLVLSWLFCFNCVLAALWLSCGHTHLFKEAINIVGTMHGSRGGCMGSGPTPPPHTHTHLENHKNMGVLAIVVLIHEKSQSYQASIQCWANIGMPANVSEMAFCWQADDGPLIVAFGSSLPKSKKRQSWTPSDKTFWIMGIICILCTGHAIQTLKCRYISILVQYLDTKMIVHWFKCYEQMQMTGYASDSL